MNARLLLAGLGSALMLSACGGSDERSLPGTAGVMGAATATTQTESTLLTRRRALAINAPTSLPAGLTTNEQITLGLYQALFGTAPSHRRFSSLVNQMNASGASVVAATLVNDMALATLSNAALSRRVLENLSITPATVANPGSYEVLEVALGQMFAAYGTGARGQIILNASRLLAGLQEDGTWGQAARALMGQLRGNAVHALNPLHAADAIVAALAADVPEPRQLITEPRLTTSEPLTQSRLGIDHYFRGDYLIFNNIWGIRSDMKLVQGQDYSSEISYLASSLQSGVQFNWRFPDKLKDPDGAGIYAYPEIAWGKPLPISGYDPNAAVATIRDIAVFKVDYSVTFIGDTANFSLLHDLWIFDEKGNISGELALYPSPNFWTTFWIGAKGYFANKPGAETLLYNDGAYSYNIVVTRHPNPQGNESWVYGMTPVDKAQGQPSSIDFLKILQFLASKGKLDLNHKIHGIELGNEIHKGSGGMRVDRYAVTLTLK